MEPEQTHTGDLAGVKGSIKSSEACSGVQVRFFRLVSDCFTK